MNDKNKGELVEESLAKTALNFIEKAIAGPIFEGTGIFTDKVKYWRFKNQVNILIKAKGFLKLKGIEVPSKIPIKDISTLLEYASFEDDEKMKDSWAKLLANTLDPNNQFDTCHIFSQILNQLSLNEIQLLEYMYSNSFIISSDNRPYFKKKSLIRFNLVSHNMAILMIDNLLRLRLIEENLPSLRQVTNGSNDIFSDSINFPENEIVSNEQFRLSLFGTELIKMINF